MKRVNTWPRAGPASPCGLPPSELWLPLPFDLVYGGLSGGGSDGASVLRSAASSCSACSSSGSSVANSTLGPPIPKSCVSSPSALSELLLLDLLKRGPLRALALIGNPIAQFGTVSTKRLNSSRSPTPSGSSETT